MPVHIVAQGESLNSIAFQHGFTWADLWDLAENQELRAKRGDPNVLYPGDEVFYPEKQEKQESGSSEAKHQFKLPGVPFTARITLRDPAHEPIAGVTWYFEVDGEQTEPQETGSDGRIVQSIPPGASSATLYVNGRAIPLKLRHLDPANTVTGIQQRLANLGYDVGPVDGVLGPRTAAAIQQFQEDERHNGLEPTGEADEATIQHLRRLHEDVELDGEPNQLVTEARQTASRGAESSGTRLEKEAEEVPEYDETDEDDEEDTVPADAAGGLGSPSTPGGWLG